MGPQRSATRRQPGLKAWLVIAWLAGCASAVAAQTVCNRAADSSACCNAEISSTISQVGDLIYISRSDGSSAVLQRVGDTSYITDSREGMSGVAQHVGDIMFIRLGRGDSVNSPVGADMWCS